MGMRMADGAMACCMQNVAYDRGWAANTIKVVPQNAMRFVVYEAAKTALGVHKSKSDT